VTQPANADRKQGATKFKPGQSGNPAGKAKGTRHKVTLAIEKLLEGEAEALTRKAIDLAKAGDMQALRICMDRLAPPRKDRSIAFEMPSIETVDDLPAATRAIMDAVSIGDITPSEAAELGKLVDAHVRAIEVSDINKRLEALERTSS
jgi:hypothetical protein